MWAVPTISSFQDFLLHLKKLNAYRANTGENGGRQNTLFPETTSRMEIFNQISEDLQYNSSRSQYLYVHTIWKFCTNIISVEEAPFTAVVCCISVLSTSFVGGR
jgi:hypothetical protein